MSFARLSKKPEILLEIADNFGVDISPEAKPAAIIKALDDDGVTWDMALASGVQGLDAVDAAAKAEEKKRKDNAPKQVLRMMRENARFDVRGYTFTRDHPYGIVAGDDAEWIVANVEGFRPATPGEVKEFYS
jgi:hypothetical protein